jgi:hypothetical protein
MVNREMFQQIHGLLLEFPELHRQQAWEAPPEATGLCGTTRCVAGWAVWAEARRLGLLSRKRELTCGEVLKAVALHHGIHNHGGPDPSALYEPVAARILGLTSDEAYDLFWDLDNDRVTDRVRSYAQTGDDLTDEEYAAF